MNKFRWILFVAARYYRTKKRERGISASLFSTLGIGVGVMAMITILGVMNGFQIGFIDDILEIDSYHLRLNSSSMRIDNGLIKKIKAVENVKSVLPFVDIQTLIKGKYSDFTACRIRAVPPEASTMDPDLVKYLKVYSGSFDLSESNSIVIGSEMAARLGADVGDTVDLLSMNGGSLRKLSPVKKQFTVKGIFKSGYYEYDSSMGFVGLSALSSIASGKEKVVYGVKLFRRYRDADTAGLIGRYLDPGENVVSWRDYNRSFFGALRMEKISMILIVGLIFLVVGVNIKHSLERSVYKRRQDIALLRSLGASPGSVKTVFVAEGVLIGVTGGLAGVAAGLLIAVNINGIFMLLARITEKADSFLNLVLSPFLSGSLADFVFLSPDYFYLQHVPVKIIYHEVVFVFMFAVVSSIMAAYTASSKISKFSPAEILRYE